jgi:hypothetical protein
MCVEPNKKGCKCSLAAPDIPQEKLREQRMQNHSNTMRENELATAIRGDGKMEEGNWKMGDAAGRSANQYFP